MRSAVFIPTIDHWRITRESYGEVLANASCITTDLTVLRVAQEAGSTVADATEYLTAAEIESNKEKAWCLSRNWYRPYWSDIVCEGIDVAHLLRNIMYLPFVSALNAHTAWHRIIEAWRPDKIFMAPPIGIPVHWSVHLHTDVPAAILLWEAERAGVDIHYLHLSATFSRQVAKELVQTVGSRTFSSFAIGHQSSHVLFIGGGRDYRDQEQLARYIAERSNHNVQQIDIGCFPSLIRSDGHIPWQLLANLPTDNGAIEEQVKQGWIEFKEAQTRGTKADKMLFANRFLDFQFQYYCEQLRQTSRVITATNLLLDCYPTSGLLVSNDTGVLRGAVYAARKRSVSSFELIHGGIAYLEIYDFATDWMVVWGQSQKEGLVRLGRPANRILVGGNYNYEPETSSDLDIMGNRRLLCEQLSIPPTNKIVLLVTTQVNSELSVVGTNLQRHLMAWQSLEAFAEDHPDISLVIKPHPVYDHPTFYEHLGAKPVSKIHMLDRAMDLLWLLNVCDAVILVNSPSTAAIEAMLRSKPVIYLRNARYPISGYQTPLDDQSTVLTIDSLEDLDALLCQVLSDNRLRKAAISKGHRLLNDFFSCLSGEALNETAGLILERLTEPTSESDDSMISVRASLAKTVNQFLDNKGRSLLQANLTAIVTAIPELHHYKEQMAWWTCGWVLASSSRPSSPGVFAALESIWTSFPASYRPKRSTRLRVEAHLHNAIAYEAEVEGQEWLAKYHHWVARFLRALSRIAQLTDSFFLGLD